MTNSMATNDRLEGVVIVADPGTPNVVVTVEVTSDPCPDVEWSFGSSTIGDNSPDFTFNNPCVPELSSPYTFTLTIASLTSATSGLYSAEFSNFFRSTPLPRLLVTVPGKWMCIPVVTHLGTYYYKKRASTTTQQ
jgi:hypothetical protein